MFSFYISVVMHVYLCSLLAPKLFLDRDEYLFDHHTALWKVYRDYDIHNKYSSFWAQDHAIKVTWIPIHE